IVDNLLAWSAQICVLAAIAAGAALMISHPRARLVFWQGVLGIALLLPMIEPWNRPLEVTIGTVTVLTNNARLAGAETPAMGFSWRREELLAIIAIGTALRLIWIGAGFLQLRRHRLAAHRLTDQPVPFESAHVRWYLSETVSGPVTFGWLRPSILLPAR